MNKKAAGVLLIFLIFCNVIFAKVLVLPFKTVKNVDKSYFWLSNALSFYISTQLNSLNIRAFTEAEITNIMNTNSINYPYRLTKASAIKIGLKNQAKKIIWGSIKITKKNNIDTLITIHSSIIDTIKLKQDFLPIIRGEIKNISLIQKTLLDSIIGKLLKKPRIKKPDLSFDNQSYELFIKSLLTPNPLEKKNLLINALDIIKRGGFNGIDLINFELAVYFFDKGKLDEAQNYLKSIPIDSNILNRKLFLESLILAKKEKFEDSIKNLTLLRKKSSFYNCIDNNIGVLYIKIGNYKQAEEYLLNSLKSGKNQIVYDNLLNLYLKTEDKEKIKDINIKLLNSFPKNIDYISLFDYLINNDKNKKELKIVFNDYLPKTGIIDYYKLEFKLNFLNPFSFSSDNTILSSYKSTLNFNEEKNNSQNNKSIEDFLQELDTAPFNYVKHLAISKKHLKIKQFRKAELYAISTVFLKSSIITLNNLIEIYKTIGDNKKLKNIKMNYK